MRFGGFCPFPLPLGGDWTAAEHGRVAADVAALQRASEFAVLTFTKSGSTFIVHEYSGQNGAGIAHAPEMQDYGAGLVLLTWSPWPDEARHDVELHPRIIAAEGTLHGNAPGQVVVTPLEDRHLAFVSIFDGAGGPMDGTVTVVVSGAASARIGDYGGAADKTDSQTEGDVPYAWTWYRALTGALGDAYTREMDSWVHVEKLATARLNAGVTRAADRLSFNALPGTSDDLLSMWQELLHVPVDARATRHETRQACGAKFRAALGPTMRNVDEALEQLLGPVFVRTWRTEGPDLATEPVPTMWPGGTPGPAGYDLGGGAWISARRHLVVEVRRPSSMPESEFLELLNVRMFRMLDDMLPSTATFNWATGITTAGGFLLDISRLDFDGMT